MVFLIGSHVFGQTVDSRGQNCNLHIGRTRVIRATLKFFNQFRFSLFRNGHNQLIRFRGAGIPPRASRSIQLLQLTLNFIHNYNSRHPTMSRKTTLAETTLHKNLWFNPFFNAASLPLRRVFAIRESATWRLLVKLDSGRFKSACRALVPITAFWSKNIRTVAISRSVFCALGNKNPKKDCNSLRNPPLSVSLQEFSRKFKRACDSNFDLQSV